MTETATLPLLPVLYSHGTVNENGSQLRMKQDDGEGMGKTIPSSSG